MQGIDGDLRALERSGKELSETIGDLMPTTVGEAWRVCVGAINGVNGGDRVRIGRVVRRFVLPAALSNCGLDKRWCCQSLLLHLFREALWVLRGSAGLVFDSSG